MTLSRQPLLRVSDNQEVLRVSHGQRWVEPAYQWTIHTKTFAPGQGFWACSQIADGGDRKKMYHPCGSTQLTRANSGATAAEGLRSLTSSFGLTAGARKDVDLAELSRVFADTQLARLIDQEVRLRREYSRLVRELRTNFRPTIAVYDNTGGLASLDPNYVKPFWQIETPLMPSHFSSDALSIADQFENDSLWLRQLTDDQATEHPQANPPAWFGGFGFKCGRFPKIRYGHHTTLYCKDDMLDLQSDTPKTVGIRVTARDVNLGFPDFSDDNGVIRVSIEDGRVNVTNLTDRFVDITNIAFYWNDLVSRADWTRELPPHAELHRNDRPQVRGLIDARTRQALRVTGATLEDLRKKTDTFGVAVRYSFVGDGGSGRLLASAKARRDTVWQR